MTQNITEALEDVNLIKKVIDRTQNDFSKVSGFFISIGVIKLFTCLLYALMLGIMNNMERVGYVMWGLLLVGGELFRVFYYIVSYEGMVNNQIIQPPFNFVFVIIGCFVMGFYLKKRKGEK